jgi:hypothetical protein
VKSVQHVGHGKKDANARPNREYERPELDLAQALVIAAGSPDRKLQILASELA